jgi:dihydroflavonol-4-reductase
MSTTARRCLVTGAGGFIGLHLANHLAEAGWRTAGVDLHYPGDDGPQGGPRFEAVVGDFRDQALMDRLLDGVDVVFHLAAAHLDQSMGESAYWDINAHSLPDVVQLARRRGVRRWVHMSSVGVYGRLAQCPANERTPAQPQSIYGRTKLAGEEAVLEAGGRVGLEVVVLRPAWVFGPGCPRTAKIRRMLARGRFVMIGRGRNLRHPLYVADLVTACELAASHHDAVGQTLLIAGPRAMPCHELIETFCQVYSLPRPRLRLPYALGYTMALLCEGLCRPLGKAPPISRRSLEFFDTDNAFDTTQTRHVLGFEPRSSLRQGLEATGAVAGDIVGSVTMK